MRGLNKVSLIGNLGKDPDIQYLEGNVAVAKISLATTETSKTKLVMCKPRPNGVPWYFGGAWRKLANKYLSKGSLVFIEGKLKTRHYNDKEDHKRYVTEIMAEQLILLDKKTEGKDDISII